MTTLASLLTDHRDAICLTLRLGKDNWCDRIQTINPLPDSPGKLNKEETWTFLAACGYAICGTAGVAQLTQLLTGRSDLHPPEDSKIWLEFQTMTPRIVEGRTRLDMALGTIVAERETKSGIELAGHSGERSWICFCEMKWESDISPRVTHDPNRNQLIRVIECALYFQSKGAFAAEVYVALVTPAVFKDKADCTRLYQSKFKEYETNDSSVLEDLKNCRLKPRNNFDASERIDALRLGWQTFDQLFASIPDSAISNGLKNFWQNYGDYLNRG